MSEVQLQKKVAGELEDISGEMNQNEEWSDSPVLPTLRLNSFTIGDGVYHVDFLFSKNAKKLHGVEIVSTTNTVTAQAALYQDLLEKLILKYGRSDDQSLWKQSMTETDEHFDHQTAWHFKSTVILLRWREMKSGKEEQTINDNLKIEYIDPVYYQKQMQDKDKL